VNIVVTPRRQLPHFFPAAIIAVVTFLGGAPAAYPQPFGSRDEVAAKNIFLVSAAALKCDNFTLVATRIAEYARQNAVDIEAFKNPEGKVQRSKAIRACHEAGRGTYARSPLAPLHFGPRQNRSPSKRRASVPPNRRIGGWQLGPRYRFLSNET
jgi:hypothetical protein